MRPVLAAVIHTSGGGKEVVLAHTASGGAQCIPPLAVCACTGVYNVILYIILYIIYYKIILYVPAPVCTVHRSVVCAPYTPVQAHII